LPKVELESLLNAMAFNWVADVTSIPTWEGVLFLAEVLDAFSRSVVGWSMDRHRLREEARPTVFDVIEGWYKYSRAAFCSRLHVALGLRKDACHRFLRIHVKKSPQNLMHTTRRTRSIPGFHMGDRLRSSMHSMASGT
jgi:hypothetical protein